MAEWVSCGGCGLKHQLRADGNCPRCRQPIGSGGGLAMAPAGAALSASAVAAPAEAAEGSSGLGMKLAGAILFANLVVGLLAVAKLGLKGAGSPVSLIIDAWLGWKLLSGEEQYKSWALVRAILGAIVWGGFALARGAPADALIQVVFSGALAALLVGEPGKVRAWLAAVVNGLLLLLMAIGLMVMDAAAVP